MHQTHFCKKGVNLYKILNLRQRTCRRFCIILIGSCTYWKGKSSSSKTVICIAKTIISVYFIMIKIVYMKISFNTIRILASNIIINYMIIWIFKMITNSFLQ